MTDDVTVDCNVVDGKRILFSLCGVVSVGWLREILQLFVVFQLFVSTICFNYSVSTICSFTKCDGVWISCFVKFLVPLTFSNVLMNVEFKLLLHDLFIKECVII